MSPRFIIWNTCSTATPITTRQFVRYKIIRNKSYVGNPDIALFSNIKISRKSQELASGMFFCAGNFESKMRNFSHPVSLSFETQVL